MISITLLENFPCKSSMRESILPTQEETMADLTTKSRILDELERAAEAASPEEKAKLRQQLRKQHGLPEKREPVLEQPESKPE